MLAEVDNAELIKMLAKKVESHRVTSRSHQTQEPQHKPVSTMCVCVCILRGVYRNSHNIR